MKTETANRISVLFIIFIILFFFTGEKASAFRQNNGERGEGRGYHHNSGQKQQPSYRHQTRPEKHYRPKHRPEKHYRPKHRPEKHYRPEHRSERYYRPKYYRPKYYRPKHYRPQPRHIPRNRPRYRHYRKHHRNRPNVHFNFGTLFFPWAGFVPVPGTVVVSLPPDCARVSVGDSFYYQHEGTYYKPVPSGYIVVDPPLQSEPETVVMPPSAAENEYTSVTAQLLNVRTGPGFHYPVLQQVQRGDFLYIKGKQNGWLYVQTSGGKSGWVVTRYTAKWEG